MRRLTDEQRDRAAKLIGLADAIAARYARRWPGYREALYDAARDGLLAAAATWRSDGGCAFPTHAWRRIQGACRDALRSGDRRRRLPVERDVGTLERWPDSRPDPRSRVDDEDAFRDILKWFAPPYRPLLESIYLHGRDQTQTGRVLGLSQSRISVLLTEARAAARDVIARIV